MPSLEVLVQLFKPTSSMFGRDVKRKFTCETIAFNSNEDGHGGRSKVSLLWRKGSLNALEFN